MGLFSFSDILLLVYRNAIGFCVTDFVSCNPAAAAKSVQSCPTLCDPVDQQQPNRLRRPWDSPGKNTGVGCHFLVYCMKVKSEKLLPETLEN